MPLAALAARAHCSNGVSCFSAWNPRPPDFALARSGALGGRGRGDLTVANYLTCVARLLTAMARPHLCVLLSPIGPRV
eukprot:scaffold241393_cov32-Tisochrysis_lutea.AAC.1